jgi:hypothetical protein
MADLIRIQCINKSDRMDPHERIRYVGGVNGDGSRWKLSEDQAIAGIRADRWQFFVERPSGHRVKVIIAKSASGREYLKTESDGEQPNNLLALSECP